MKLSEITVRDNIRNPRRPSEFTKLIKAAETNSPNMIEMEVHETGAYVTLTYGGETSIVGMGNISCAKVMKAAPKVK